MATPLERWVDEQAALTRPKKVYWCDGSEEEARRLIDRAELLSPSPCANSRGERGIDGERDDGEDGQAHQEFDEGESLRPPPPFPHALTPASGRSRWRQLEGVPAAPTRR